MFKYEWLYANSKDIPSWLVLLDKVQNNFPGLDKAQYAKNLNLSISKREAIVVKDKDKIIGALAFTKEDYEILFLAVDPEYRHQKIATILIKTIINIAPPKQNISVVTYRENDSLGKAARCLYLHLGFSAKDLFEQYDYPVQRFVFERNESK